VCGFASGGYPAGRKDLPGVHIFLAANATWTKILAMESLPWTKKLQYKQVQQQQLQQQMMTDATNKKGHASNLGTKSI